VPAPKGRIRLVGGGLVLSNIAVKVLAPGGSPTGSIKRSWHSQCAGGREPNRPKVSCIVKGSACSQAPKAEEKIGFIEPGGRRL
jgi:hypothetical protein